MAIYSSLFVSGNNTNTLATNFKSTNENVLMPPFVVVAPNVAKRPRYECSSAAVMFQFQRQQQQEKKLRRTQAQALAPSPAHNVVVIKDKVHEYDGEVAELGFYQATSTSTTFNIENTDEFKWLMAEVATIDEDDRHDSELIELIDAFPQPPTFSASKATTDKRRKRHGVVFDFPKVQTGVDCGNWW